VLILEIKVIEKAIMIVDTKIAIISFFVNILI